MKRLCEYSRYYTTFKEVSRLLLTFIMWRNLCEDLKMSVILGDEYIPIKSYGNIIIADIPKNIVKDDFYIQLNSSKEKYVTFEFNNNSINLIGYNITFNGFQDDDGFIKSLKLQYLKKLNVSEEQRMKASAQKGQIVMKIYNSERKHSYPTKTYVDGSSCGVDEVDGAHNYQDGVIGFSTHKISDIHYEKTTATRGEFLFETTLVLHSPVITDIINIL